MPKSEALPGEIPKSTHQHKTGCFLQQSAVVDEIFVCACACACAGTDCVEGVHAVGAARAAGGAGGEAACVGAARTTVLH